MAKWSYRSVSANNNGANGAMAMAQWRSSMAMYQ